MKEKFHYVTTISKYPSGREDDTVDNRLLIKARSEDFRREIEEIIEKSTVLRKLDQVNESLHVDLLLSSRLGLPYVYRVDHVDGVPYTVLRYRDLVFLSKGFTLEEAKEVFHPRILATYVTNLFVVTNPPPKINFLPVVFEILNPPCQDLMLYSKFKNLEELLYTASKNNYVSFVKIPEELEISFTEPFSQLENKLVSVVKTSEAVGVFKRLSSDSFLSFSGAEILTEELKNLGFKVFKLQQS